MQRRYAVIFLKVLWYFIHFVNAQSNWLSTLFSYSVKESFELLNGDGSLELCSSQSLGTKLRITQSSSTTSFHARLILSPSSGSEKSDSAISFLWFLFHFGISFCGPWSNLIHSCFFLLNHTIKGAHPLHRIPESSQWTKWSISYVSLCGARAPPISTQ